MNEMTAILKYMKAIKLRSDAFFNNIVKYILHHDLLKDNFSKKEHS